MGTWGITTFESDSGLDAIDLIRGILPKNGEVELSRIIEALQNDDLDYPKDPKEGYSHTSPMAVAEVVSTFLEGKAGDMDYDEDWAANDNKFRDVKSFTADNSSISWLRDYLSSTLDSAIENATFRSKYAVEKHAKWGGWVRESDWASWKDHMSMLIGKLDNLLASESDIIEIFTIPKQTYEYLLKPVALDEQKLFFSNDSDVDQQTGCIGHYPRRNIIREELQHFH